MTATTQHPKAFISYSWSSVEHEQFVLELATALRNHGVDAILDKWDLKPGQDKYAFMESMVTDSAVSRVLVICDRIYQQKANARAGGVGTESQIISQELYGKVKQTKFIPVICEYDEDDQACLPVFMKHLIYVDVSSDERYGAGLDELLRLIYEQPLHEKPRLGAPPAFTSNAGQPYAKELAAAARAIQDGKPNRQGLEHLLLKSVLGEIERLYSEPEGNDYHEKIYAAIQATKGLRDQMSDYCETVAAFSNDDPSAIGPVIKLLEGIGTHFGPPENKSHYYAGWADVYRYFALEVLLILVAALIRHTCWKSLRRIVTTTFIVRGRNGELKAEGFFVFNTSIVSIDDHRNRALNLQRVSVSADLLKERSATDKTTFLELQEADVFLTLAAVAKMDLNSGGSSHFWTPRTAVYFHYSAQLPLFIRAGDEHTRNGILSALSVENGAALKLKFDEVSKLFNGFGRLSLGTFSDFNFLDAVNAEKLTR